MTAKLSAEEVIVIRDAIYAGVSGLPPALNDRVCQLVAKLCDATSDALAQVREAEALIADLQAHAKEEGWQDVDEPVAALLAYPLPPPPARESHERDKWIFPLHVVPAYSLGGAGTVDVTSRAELADAVCRAIDASPIASVEVRKVPTSSEDQDGNSVAPPPARLEKERTA